MRRSLNIGLISTFAAFHVTLYFLSFGLWRNWAIYLEAVEGVILGPWAGFLAAFLGSVIARMIKPNDFWMFGIGAEPLAVLACGFLARGRWKPVFVIYAVMLCAYFVHPFGRWLPFWTILDILLAFVLVYPVSKMAGNLFEQNLKRLPASMVLLSFVGSATDALTRVFLFIPAGLYTLFGLTPGAVYSTFVMGAIDSYVEDVLVVVVSFLVGVPILVTLRRIPRLRSLLTSRFSS
jgi:hypothetical protein